MRETKYYNGRPVTLHFRKNKITRRGVEHILFDIVLLKWECLFSKFSDVTSFCCLFTLSSGHIDVDVHDQFTRLSLPMTNISIIALIATYSNFFSGPKGVEHFITIYIIQFY